MTTIYPLNYPLVCFSGYEPCSFYGINYAMLKSLVSIQNGRVCYQGCPPNIRSNVDIERLNEAIKIVMEAFPMLSQSGMVGGWGGKNP